MIDFAADTAAIFADVVAQDATYTPDGGAPVSVRVIPRRADADATFGGARLVSGAAVFLLPVAMVAAPEAGDTIVTGGQSYTVQGAPERDERHRWWRIEARPA